MLEVARLATCAFCTRTCSPWASGDEQIAGSQVESALGAHPANLSEHWYLDTDCDPEDLAARMPQNPTTWSEGGLDRDQVSAVCVAGGGTSASLPSNALDQLRWTC